MKLSHLVVRGVAGLREIDVDLRSSSGKPHELVVVTGPEASGKTRLLELLLAGLETVGPYQGIVRASDWLPGPDKSARLELGLWLDDSERESVGGGEGSRAVVGFGPEGVICDATRDVVKLASRYDHDPAHGKREYFPENRQRAWGGRQDGTGALEQSLWRASKDADKYSFVPQFLVNLAREATRRRVFEDGLAALAPSLRFAPGETAAAATPMIRLANTPLFSTQGEQVTLGELSSSEANAVIIAATAAMTGLSHSIILLDRPELHVAPERLVAWVHALSGLGQENQWIVATSSHRLRSAVEPSQIVSTREAVGS